MPFDLLCFAPIEIYYLPGFFCLTRFEKSSYIFVCTNILSKLAVVLQLQKISANDGVNNCKCANEITYIAIEDNQG